MIEEYTITGNTEAYKTYKVIDLEGTVYGYFKSVDESKGFIRGIVKKYEAYYDKDFAEEDFRIEEVK